jgi:Ca2+-binding RTX toxin-like protein
VPTITFRCSAISAGAAPLANTLTGNGAANVLNGKAGADTMIGGLGDDLYYVDSAGDTVREGSATGGTDKVSATVSFTLGAHVEQLVLGGSGAIDGTGNALENVITGNAAANVLKGLAGADSLKGGPGDDTLVGGAAQDMLTGGAGNDTFVFAATDTSADHAVADHILDFATGDRIDLHLIDANTGVAGNQAFHFIGIHGFTPGDAGALHYSTGGGITWIEGDVDGDGKAHFAIYLAGNHAMAGTDFVL